MTEYKIGDHVKLTENGKECASNVHSGRDSVYKITKLKGSNKLNLMEVGEPHRTISDIKDFYVYPVDDSDGWFSKGDYVVLTEAGKKFITDNYLRNLPGALVVLDNDFSGIPYRVAPVDEESHYAWLPKDGIKAAFQFKQGDTVVLTGKGHGLSGNAAELARLTPPIRITAIDTSDYRHPYRLTDVTYTQRWVSADAIKAAPAGPKYAVGDRVIINEAGQESDRKHHVLDYPNYAKPVTVDHYYTAEGLVHPYKVTDENGISQMYKESELDPAPTNETGLTYEPIAVTLAENATVVHVISSDPQLDLETVKFILGNLLQALKETSTTEKAVDTMEGYLQGLITGLEGKCSNETAGEIYANSRQ